MSSNTYMRIVELQQMIRQYETLKVGLDAKIKITSEMALDERIVFDENAVKDYAEIKARVNRAVFNRYERNSFEEAIRKANDFTENENLITQALQKSIHAISGRKDDEKRINDLKQVIELLDADDKNKTLLKATLHEQHLASHHCEKMIKKYEKKIRLLKKEESSLTDKEGRQNLQDTLQNKHKYALNIRRITERFYSVFTSVKRIKTFEDKPSVHPKPEHTETLKEALRHFDYFSGAFTLIDMAFSVYRLIDGLFINRDNKPESAIQTLLGFLGIAIGVLTTLALLGVIVIITPILVLLGSIKLTLNSALKLGVDIYNRFFSDASNKREDRIKILMNGNVKTHGDLYELTKLINQRNEQNRAMAQRINGLITGCIAIAASVLLFTPLAPIGVGIFAGLAVYGLMDVFKINPFVLAARGINALYKKIAGKPMAFNPLDTLTEKEALQKYKEKQPVAAQTISSQKKENTVEKYDVRYGSEKRLSSTTIALKGESKTVDDAIKNAENLIKASKKPPVTEIKDPKVLQGDTKQKDADIEQQPLITEKTNADRADINTSAGGDLLQSSDSSVETLGTPTPSPTTSKKLLTVDDDGDSEGEGKKSGGIPHR